MCLVPRPDGLFEDVIAIPKPLVIPYHVFKQSVAILAVHPGPIQHEYRLPDSVPSPRLHGDQLAMWCHRTRRRARDCPHLPGSHTCWHHWRDALQLKKAVKLPAHRGLSDRSQNFHVNLSHLTFGSVNMCGSTSPSTLGTLDGPFQGMASQSCGDKPLEYRHAFATHCSPDWALLLTASTDSQSGD